MADIEFKVYFNNKPATLAELDAMEEVVVEQEADMSWEGRIRLPVFADTSGKWSGEDKDYTRPFSRARVEIKVGGGAFVPLIDGPVVNLNNDKSPEPGRSTMTMVVSDDSMYMNSKDEHEVFDDMADHDIAASIFSRYSDRITSTRVESTRSGPAPMHVVKTGTDMDLLRILAKRHGKHAYVLPGKTPGQSKGVFAAFSTTAGVLPPLVLMGSGRNIDGFNVVNNADRPGAVKGSVLRIKDKSIITSTSNAGSLDLLGDLPGLKGTEDGGEGAERILFPAYGEHCDLNEAVQAEADRLCYAFTATGKVLGDCYKGVLEPYRVVTVMGADERLSGNYIITAVRHTLTRSSYSQDFTLKRNAVSDGPTRSAAGQAAEIF